MLSFKTPLKTLYTQKIKKYFLHFFLLSNFLNGFENFFFYLIDTFFNWFVINFAGFAKDASILEFWMNELQTGLNILLLILWPLD